MTLLILAEIAVALLATTASVVLYAARSPWRESRMGRHLMVFMFAMMIEFAALLALGLGMRLPLFVYALTFAAVDAVVLQRLWLLIKAQRD